ncbi:hypothetical protein AOQ84DRAFT_326846 [Glonium stellatum]|uniref:RED-like N-terminal domain-containing protein n=1 Tax=Glonium stellatum TaxID=574774 RepID=A0A8E2ER07_9PEZI|nr:hypothetical protein AOQ84DRAFT_326846 [Glonium stellatum]
MNNQQFRRLVLDTPARTQNDNKSPSKTESPFPASLGSRMRSNIPMTPRTVRGSTNIDFARQLAERKSESQLPNKFRSSAAPKGTKLAAGYRDRTQDRVDSDSDEKAQRIKALEESMKLGQIDRGTFERLVENITGGDIEATHLVKGLDRKLLERVRRGEDVLGEASKKEETQKDIDEEFEKLEEKTVAPVVKEKVQKKGEIAPPPVSGVKRTRDTILAELKASRKAAAEAAAAEKAIKYPELGPGFRKVGRKRETTKLEKDEKGREILIIVDHDGNVKRKVRKMKQDDDAGLAALDKAAKPLDWGVKVPDLPQAEQHPSTGDEDDDDIFEGVGTDYNPLAELGEAETSPVSENEDVEDNLFNITERSIESVKPDDTLPQNPSQTMAPRRSYFDKPPLLSTAPPSNPLADPNIIAALKKVQKLDPTSSVFATSQDEDRLNRRAAMLSTSDRDLEDMDLGFGSSRFDDTEEMEGGERIKLSEWDDTGKGNEDRHGGSKQRKRGPKKRRGDKNSAADVLKVMQKNKASNAK